MQEFLQRKQAVVGTEGPDDGTTGIPAEV